MCEPATVYSVLYGTSGEGPNKLNRECNDCGRAGAFVEMVGGNPVRCFCRDCFSAFCESHRSTTKVIKVITR
jgi:hypothetical protein